MLIRVRGSRRAAADVDLREDIAEVSSDRLFAEKQDRRDAPIGVPLRHQNKHFTLPSSQRVPSGGAIDGPERSKIRSGA